MGEGQIAEVNPLARRHFGSSDRLTARQETSPLPQPMRTELLIRNRPLWTPMFLTAAERILLHLLPLWNVKESMREATQEGIAEGTGLRRSHVPRAVKRLVTDSSVEVREGRLHGRGRKVRIHVLTESGIRRGRELLAGLESEEVRFGERRVAIGALAAELGVG